MWKVFALLGIFICHNSFSVCGSTVKSRTYEFSHQVDLRDLHGIHIQWRHFQAKNHTNGDKHPIKWLEMKVTGRTTGYVGVGFSPSGGMSGADMVIGWVDHNRKSHLKDFYGEWNGKPIEDKSQDYILVNASEYEDHTMIHFKRKWDTCDQSNDLPIMFHEMLIIWALGDEDPVENKKGKLQMSWHGATNRGSHSAFMIHDAAFLRNEFKLDDQSYIHSRINEIKNDILGNSESKNYLSNSCQRKQRISSVQGVQKSSQNWIRSLRSLVILCSTVFCIP